MQDIRQSAPQLQGVEPYDPKYIPADVMISANENPRNIEMELQHEVARAVRKVSLNRYPDPLANDLRDMIADANGLDRDQVLMGNGGDELLFDFALAYGGPGRKFLNTPPTFSVYAYNANLTNTEVVDVPRLDDYSVDVDAVCDRLSQGDIDFAIITSPNNPTGNMITGVDIERILNASNAIIMVDEAYFEFSRFTVRPSLETHENLIILRTFSKAFSLAGVRMGYLLGSERVLREFKKVRQPYSVDAVSQAIARVVYENRAQFEKSINELIEERDRVIQELDHMPGITAYPSSANYVLFRLADGIDAGEVWQKLLDASVLVRDFSRTPRIENCLRVSVGTAEENTRFLATLRGVLG